MESPASTETGIDISNYISDKEHGTVALKKLVKNSGNYVFMRSTYSLKTIDGIPQAVEGPPEIKNINRQTVADFAVVLQRREDEINALREQLAAILADMDEQDAA